MPPRHWQSHRHLLAIVLQPLSWLYSCAWRLRAKLFRMGVFKTHRLPVPVIIVGNVVAGGVGKTPIVMALVERLKSQGLYPGVVSRGYGRTNKKCMEVLDISTVADVGDEPLLIHRMCKIPVVVAANRVQAARTLLAMHPECNILVSDDGLQHLQLGRDVEIVVFDGRSVGNGILLPAGPLREPWPRIPRCKTHLTLQNVPRSLNAIAIDGKGQHYTINNLRNEKLYAIAGIAKPESFFQMLRDQGLVLASTRAYSDHHPLDKVKMPLDGLLICTAKDAVKLWPRYPEVVAIGLHLELDATFLAVFDATIASLTANPLS